MEGGRRAALFLYIFRVVTARQGYQGRNVGRALLGFTRQHLPDEIELRCIRENEEAWRWYERKGFAY